MDATPHPILTATACPEAPESVPFRPILSLEPFNALPLAAQGTCTVTVIDKKGSQVAVTVTVAYPTLAFASQRTAGNLIALFTMQADGSSSS